MRGDLPPEGRPHSALSCRAVYADRRQRFLSAMGDGAVALIQGASLVTRSADTEFPFRQDSDFHYLTSTLR